MFQDSVPAGSYNDPFLSSVCVCVCVCVCVFIAKETIVLTQWGAGPGLRRESQNIALVLFLFFWGVLISQESTSQILQDPGSFPCMNSHRSVRLSVPSWFLDTNRLQGLDGWKFPHQDTVLCGSAISVLSKASQLLGLKGGYVNQTWGSAVEVIDGYNMV